MKQSFQSVYFGDIKPSGWMFEQMNHDLKHGFVGKLDKIVPHLITEDPIYGENRLTKEVKKKDVGAISQDDEWEVQYLWWNSETQSNWWDGFVRHSFLTEDEESIRKVQDYVEKILSYQDEDGYLGIYEKDLRFRFEGENGELWAQSTLFRVLLGYYEVTKDEQVLQALIKAVGVTMKSYPLNESTPFYVKDSYAGVCHGLTLVDALERLSYLTGNEQYKEYAAWLYEDYCKHELSESDIQLSNLLDDSKGFNGHGVHTYEHLRALTYAYYTVGNKNLKKGLTCYLEKLEKAITPSGGPIGDEWIAENTAHATETGYEYCSIHELLHSYAVFLEKTGDMKWADKMEWLLYNAGQGARHPHESSIAYLKTDNSYAMEGKFQQEQPHCTHKIQTRYKYSPSHQDAAVCCVPNAGRLFPYFVQNMWMKNEKGVVAVLYGPSTFDFTFNDISTKISQKTNYPFDDCIVFELHSEEKTDFQLTLRKPKWAKNMTVTVDEASIYHDHDRIVIQKKWEKHDQIIVKFEQGLNLQSDLQGEKYLTYGPFLLAIPLLGEEVIVKEFDVPGFKDIHYKRATNIPTGVLPNTLQDFIILKNQSKCWGEYLKVKGYLQDAETHKKMDVTFVPMGDTILRKVTFS